MPSPSVAQAAPPVVPDMLRFTATTVDGKAFDGASLAGKPAVLWFWAAWCTKCQGHAAEVRDLQAAAGSKANVVGVAGLKSGSSAMSKFVADYRLTAFPHLADDKGDVWKRFEVPTQDYYVILDASGTVVQRGSLAVAQVRTAIGA